MRFGKRLAALAILAGGLALAGSTPARAAFSLTLTDVGTSATVTVNDDGLGDLANPDLGTITVVRTVGVFRVNITIVTSSPGTGPLGAMVQDVSITTRNTSGATDTLRADVTSDGFLNPGLVNTPVTLESALASSFVAGTGTFTSSLNGQPTVPTLTLTGIGAVSTATGVIVTTVPYTLTNTLTVALAGNTTGQFTGTTSVTPEPGTMAMAVSALSLFGLARLRRRKQA